MDDELNERVIEVVAGVLDATADEVRDAPLATFEQWDSLCQLNLLLALEEHFGLELSPDDVGQLESTATITRLIDSRR